MPSSDHHSAYMAKALAALPPAGHRRVDELQGLLLGFRTIRDEEPLDDVADWANAVLALPEDEAAR